MNPNISLDSLFANNPHINFSRNLNLIPNYVNGYSRLFKNCTGLLSPPILNIQPLSDWFYYQMFMNCNALPEVFVNFDSCFQPGLSYNNGQFTEWLYCEDNPQKQGVIYSYSDQLIGLLNSNQTARKMMVPNNWQVQKASF